MRRIAILFIILSAAVCAFAQTAPPAGAMRLRQGLPPRLRQQGPHPKSPEENAAVLGDEQGHGSRFPHQGSRRIDEQVSGYGLQSSRALTQACLKATTIRKTMRKPSSTAEQSLEADPKNFETLLLMAEIYAQTTRETDLDKDDQVWLRSTSISKDALSANCRSPQARPLSFRRRLGKREEGRRSPRVAGSGTHGHPPQEV